jgi:deoxyribonuclease V
VINDWPRNDWPRTTDEALAVQDALRSRVEPGPGPAQPATVAGLDVAYHPDGERLAAAVVVLDTVSLAVVDTAVVLGRPAFGYVPGLFAFRELPALLEALDRLTVRPEVLVCDGHGLAHPRRFGLACHIGVLTGLPSYGVGKTPLVGRWETPGDRRGDASPLIDAPWPPGAADPGADNTGSDNAASEQVLGCVLRTRAGVKPVFVSTGHRMDLGTAVALTLALTPAYRLPETTRAADHACRAALARAV